MVAFNNDHAPGWMFLDRNPHPLGNDNHAITFCGTKIVFSMDLVEGKHNLEGAHVSLEFKEEIGFLKLYHFVHA